jgi:glutamate dehydrogenase/leucine dehydrogenase
VQITKLTGTDAFVAVDLASSDRASGIVRWAKKVLQDGAGNLARHLTYGYASLGIEASGASAGINSDPDGRADAIAAFSLEAAVTNVRFDPGKGVSAADLAALAATDDRSPALADHRAELVAAGAHAALEAAIGSLSGCDVAIEGAPFAADELSALLTASGATVTTVDAGMFRTACDVLCVGSKVGAVDHENAPAVSARTILPLTPLPITARGLATAGRAGVTVLPDFITLAGPLVAHWPGPDATLETLTLDLRSRVGTAISAVLDHPEGPLLGACEAAETFLLTWQSELPFGRPIA